MDLLAVLQQVLLQTGLGTSQSNAWLIFLSNIIWIAMIFLFFFQDYVMIWRYAYTVGSFLTNLNRLITNNVNLVINHVDQLLRSNGSPKNVNKDAIEKTIKDLMDFVVIEPVNAEPTGLMRTLKLLVTTYNDRLEDSIRSLLPSIERTLVQNVVDAVDGLRELNFIYKVIMHYYRLSNKYRNPYLMMQVYMLLPILREYVNALNGAISTFLKGQPVGDAAGPLTAYRFMRSCSSVEEISHNVKDTYIGLCNFEGRRVYVVKARGPGGTVGNLDDGIAYLVERVSVKPRFIITVDAALKLEGERTGSIAEGVGVAMGGIGVERFNIERIASKYGIPLYAVLIKMSMPEALSAMPKEVEGAVNDAVERVKRVIREGVREGEEVILVGVGNTGGVAQ
ncbi:hypothetical protein B7L70_03220 [Vulcanisaeta sp. EB80]|jgi:hypothetical protein|uniref:DUF1512 domain-containing protein n=1 Tax=Vulcanisaeta sp. EB80 TaxID=1650660 RepID=UPI0009C0ED95|nr:DUF1512 domain-containing protein [Vulcanisaeta sp. EB80]MCG2866689.1 DUF1512 domain-containing protein [Vulcanisaeta sp.]MCG2885487.1 DUF1512 domain-containing protein [Vulcanisaeta sp.]MDT7863750.1 DUF1512 domain-containing protein [Vulcanisaeta sp.]MDT7970165.1 DUF1512 domain-containing protein [Vulcanisaeta sp.]PLC68477.1 hypothetical protein B7L70_03220 [Vulcanisaeta sp. EB80]